MNNSATNRPARHLTRIAGGILAIALASTIGLTPTAEAAPNTSTVATVDAAPAAPAAKRSGWKPRGEQYPMTVTRKDLAIPMDDGVVLRGDLTLPAKTEGVAIKRRVPVIVTLTAYNKSVLGAGGGSALAGGDPAYLVKRGYAQLTVDVRGTGSSAGQWAAFSAREGKDDAAVVTWAAKQKWSNGKVGMTGPSYMGISQLFAAAGKPKGLKAIFPQVPAADVYRDVVASGGQIDVGFIPLWLGLVTATGVVPPAFGAQEPAGGFKVLLDHLMAGGSFTLPLIATALLGGDPAYDGAFYQERSPIQVIDKVKVPTFFIGGEFDLFQRGTPLDFEALQKNGVPTKFIWGPWDHLQGSSGAQVGDAGYGTLSELQLRWFDHWIKGKKTQLGKIAPLTYYEQGTGRWVQAKKWIGRDLSARSLKLSGSAATAGAAGALTNGKRTAGESTVVPVPVTGLCTRSANQWTAGLPSMVLADLPCFKDNQYNDYGGVNFETEPMAKKLRFQGPLNARLYASTPTGDGMLSVAVEDVAPDGTVTRITGGWQVIAHRKLIKSKSRYLDGQLIQPFHPFTKAAKKNLAAGEVAPIDVEIFPTAAGVKKGHRLRLAIQMFDIPHLLSPLPDLPGQLAPVTIHTSKLYPSVLTLPVR